MLLRIWECLYQVKPWLHLVQDPVLSIVYKQMSREIRVRIWWGFSWITTQGVFNSEVSVRIVPPQKISSMALSNLSLNLFHDSSSLCYRGIKSPQRVLSRNSTALITAIDWTTWWDVKFNAHWPKYSLFLPADPTSASIWWNCWCNIMHSCQSNLMVGITE